MRKCPLCNAEVKPEFPDLMYLEQIKEWSFLHHCNENRSIFITAKTLEGLIAEWNGEHEEQTSESL